MLTAIFDILFLKIIFLSNGINETETITRREQFEGVFQLQIPLFLSISLYKWENVNDSTKVTCKVEAESEISQSQKFRVLFPPEKGSLRVESCLFLFTPSGAYSLLIVK